ncbi:MAG: proton-conducting transporter membrane subunit [Planctomycetota bacterium]
MRMIVTLAILIPMLGAALCVVAWGHIRTQHAIGIASALGLCAVAATLIYRTSVDGTQVVAMGGWATPYGIALVADRFSAIMVSLAAIVGLAVAIYSVGATDRQRASYGHVPLVLAMIAAVCGAFLSGDLFNLYVWFELMLLSSFVLLTLGGERPQLEGAIKYVALNLFSSIVFLATTGVIYATVGTLNMAHLAERLDALENPMLATSLGAPLLVAFGIKAAVFPFFFWLPASYHTPPPVVSALFAGLLTKVGVYSLIRATTLLFDQEQVYVGHAMLVVAALTMVTGVFGAVTQNDMRRILSFHIVSQIGYMLMGLGVALTLAETPGAEDAAALAMVGSVFYIMHHIVVKTNLFLIAGAVIRVRGTSDLKSLGGIVSTHPFLSILFLISSLSLAGIPILSGFWAKLVLVRAGLEAGAFWIVGVSLAVSLLTLFSMMKIWTRGFWGAAPEQASPADEQAGGSGLAMVYLPIVGLALITLAIGFGAPAIYDVAVAAAADLLDPEVYIRAVLPRAVGAIPEVAGGAS